MKGRKGLVGKKIKYENEWLLNSEIFDIFGNISIKDNSHYKN